MILKIVVLAVILSFNSINMIEEGCLVKSYDIEDIAKNELDRVILARVDSIYSKQVIYEEVLLYYEKYIESGIELLYIMRVGEKKVTIIEIEDSLISKKEYNVSNSLDSFVPVIYHTKVYSRDCFVEDGAISILAQIKGGVPISYMVSHGITWREKNKCENNNLTVFYDWMESSEFWSLIK